MAKPDEIGNIEFKWGKKKGIGGKKKDIQFYESFTYDGEKYMLFDSVYMWKDDEPEPYIGKLIKIWEHRDKTKKVKVLWFFRPCEISNYLGVDQPLENELFLASGDGQGLANVNHLEAVAGKCNVVCMSKDNRNHQLSVMEIQMADFVFYRTFDVKDCVVLDKICEKIADVDVKFLFNKGKPMLNNNDVGVNELMDKTTLDGNALQEHKTKNLDGNLVDSSTFEKFNIKVSKDNKESLLHSKSSNDLMHGISFNNEIKFEAQENTSLKTSVVQNSCLPSSKANHKDEQGGGFIGKTNYEQEENVGGKTREVPQEKEMEQLKEPICKEGLKEVFVSDQSKNLSGQNIMNAETISTSEEVNNKPFNEFDDRLPRKMDAFHDRRIDCEQKRSPKLGGSMKPRPYLTKPQQTRLDNPDGVDVTTLKKLECDEKLEKSSLYINEIGTKTSNLKTSAPFDTLKRSNDPNWVAVGPLKKLRSEKFEKLSSDIADSVARVAHSKPSVLIDKSKHKVPHDHNSVEMGQSKELRPGEKLEKLGKGKSVKASRTNQLKKGDETGNQSSETIEEKTVDKSKWFALPWKQRTQHAHQQGRLVILQNLDPTCTSAEVEELVWRAFKERCVAKMMQQNAFSRPNFGQAFVIFDKQESAMMVVKKLDESSILLSNGRVLVGCFPGSSFLQGQQSTFFGHLIIDKLRHQMQREMKEAVSTSHCSQPNTIEYEMAMEWCLLQERLECTRKKLVKRQEQELRSLKAKLRPR